MEKNGVPLFLGVLTAIGVIGYLFLSIFTSELSEALKYFAITLILFIILSAYIELIIKKLVKK